MSNDNDTPSPQRLTMPASASLDYARSRQDGMQPRRVRRSSPHSPLSDSWVEVASEPSSSSLSSMNDDRDPPNRQPTLRARRRRQPRASLNPIHHPSSIHVDGTSSQEEYEESESESDRVLTSSGEGPFQHTTNPRNALDDDDRTAINHPLRRTSDNVFTPQPNAFSHPSATTAPGRFASAPGSYFPPTAPSSSRPATNRSLTQEPRRSSHLPQNLLTPTGDHAAYTDALRTSLDNLLSISSAFAARRGTRPDIKERSPTQPLPARTNRVDPASLCLVPGSALPTNSPTQLQEPTFSPTIRRTTSTSTSASSEQAKANKRKALVAGRSTSRERRLKKARRSSSTASSSSTMDEVTPTLLTWVVSAGVVILVSALSFSAGYNIGKESGRLEVMELPSGTDESLKSCAQELISGRNGTGMGLKRSLARSAVQV